METWARNSQSTVFLRLQSAFIDGQNLGIVLQTTTVISGVAGM